MSIYTRAQELASMLTLVLLHDPHVQRGSILIVLEGDDPGVYIHPADAE
jgi:hypothetical protein